MAKRSLDRTRRPTRLFNADPVGICIPLQRCVQHFVRDERKSYLAQNQTPGLTAPIYFFG
jgi:hypothetical protein